MRSCPLLAPQTASFTSQNVPVPVRSPLSPSHRRSSKEVAPSTNDCFNWPCEGKRFSESAAKEKRRCNENVDRLNDDCRLAFSGNCNDSHRR